MTFDAAGNLYVTDAHEGMIWKVGPAGGAGTVWAMKARSQANQTPARHRRQWPGVQQTRRTVLFRR